MYVIIAGNIFIKSGSDSFAVTHFSENSAVGGGDTLDCVCGVVRIKADII